MKYIFVKIYLFVAFKLAECALDPFISGGSFVPYRQYPHSVFLIVDCKTTLGCGGSILNQNIVLTAAHCTEACDQGGLAEIHVKYGHNNIEEMKTTFMENYIQHEHYDTASVVNDIGLISTKDKMILDTAAKRVIILASPPIMDFGDVAGWGLDEDGETKTIMKHTKAQIQPPDVCDMIFGKLPPGIFCAGPLTGLGTPQQGDSGSALVVFERIVQIGIVSHNVPDYSLVAYTNVSYYLPWIRKKSKLLYCAEESLED